MESTQTAAAETPLSLQGLMDLYRNARAAGEEEVKGRVQVALASTTERTSRNGRAYDIVRVGDTTGSLEAKDFRRQVVGLGSPQYMEVEFKIETYKGGPSAVVEAVSVLDPDQVDENDFCRFDEDANIRHRRQLRQVIESMSESSPYRAVVEAVLEDAVLEQFCTWPAAVVNHHNYKGGLLEHTLEVLRYAHRIAAIDEQPYDKDLLTAACLLHDIGKLDEYTGPPVVDRGLGGEFAYHLAFGQIRLGMAVERLRGRGTPVSKKVVYQLAHCIEMSHGAHRLDQQRKFVGKEARALAAADDYSAKLRPRDGETVTLDKLAAVGADAF